MENINENQIIKTLSYHDKGAETKLKNNKTDRTGEVNYNKYGSKMTIVEYIKSSDIMVEFENGYITRASYERFKKGTIKSPYDRTICGVGVVGLQNICPNVNPEYKKSYDKWRGMITRCYNKKAQEKQPSYKGCSVCNEWLFYPNFKKWYDDNYYEIEGEQMHLDKDILFKGNKVYSPDTCIFVPERINAMFVKCDKRRGNCPIGVNYRKKANKYIAQCNDGSHGNAGLGSFDNPIDAFYKYKNYKEKNIRIVANEYKEQIPLKLYEAMYKWKVEITD